MDWQDVPETVDQWVTKIAATAYDVRTLAADVITRSHIGYYCQPDGRVGVFAPLATTSDTTRTKAAASRAVGSGAQILSLSYQDLSSPTSTWVKIAYSPTLRRAGELLNFFPGQYPGGVPNSPSPLAAMLTSGLVGAGLGYGGGRLIGAALPEGYGKKLGRTGAILGGALGAAPGAIWGATNTLVDRKFNDPSLLNAAAGSAPDMTPRAINGNNQPFGRHSGNSHSVLEDIRDAYQQAPEPHPTPVLRKHSADEPQLSLRYRRACEKVAATFETPKLPFGVSGDVNIDALGRTLWDSGASPALAASTMSGVYAARQLPDSNARPGWVTGHQLGQLSANAAGDYATGLLVGAVLNRVAGTPHRASAFGTGAAALGVIGAVVPKLFGG